MSKKVLLGMSGGVAEAVRAERVTASVCGAKNEKPRVLLGMSGGVDSSVSALLLKEAGYDVTGMTMSLCEGSACCNLNSMLDAKEVCKKVGIEHYILDYKDEFKAKVIDDFINEYKNCRTPNPCIQCNKHLKFGEMYKKAQEMGIEYISTGHYARVEYSEKYGRAVLKKAKNLAKDQSYVLYVIPKELLDKVIFPLGDYESKDQIREIAKEHGFVVASKPDSEDICFIPNGNYKRYLEENSDIKEKEGNIVNLEGKVLGKHTGLYKYTIGQRKGLGISNAVPLFVIGYNAKNNELIVGEEDKLYKNEMLVKKINLLAVDRIDKPMEVAVKTRYSQKEAEATIEMIDNDTVKVTFKEPQARITPGQSAVFYDEDTVIGGGIIS